MKQVLGLLSSVLFIFNVNANAVDSYLSCSNGSIDIVGDGYYQIDILEDGIQFLPYEGAFSLDLTQVGYNDGTFSIINQSTTLTSEGDEYPLLVNAMLLLNKQRNKLSVSISDDRGPFRTYEMTCVETKVTE